MTTPTWTSHNIDTQVALAYRRRPARRGVPRHP